MASQVRNPITRNRSRIQLHIFQDKKDKLCQFIFFKDLPAVRKDITVQHATSSNTVIIIP